MHLLLLTNLSITLVIQTQVKPPPQKVALESELFPQTVPVGKFPPAVVED